MSPACHRNVEFTSDLNFCDQGSHKIEFKLKRSALKRNYYYIFWRISYMRYLYGFVENIC